MILRNPTFAHEIEIGDDPIPGEAVHLPWLACDGGGCDDTHLAVVLEVRRDFDQGGMWVLVALSISGQPPGLPIRTERFTSHWTTRP